MYILKYFYPLALCVALYFQLVVSIGCGIYVWNCQYYPIHHIYKSLNGISLVHCTMHMLCSLVGGTQSGSPTHSTIWAGDQTWWALAKHQSLLSCQTSQRLQWRYFWWFRSTTFVITISGLGWRILQVDNSKISGAQLTSHPLASISEYNPSHSWHPTYWAHSWHPTTGIHNSFTPHPH